jgi:hypothetical protein
MSNSAKVPPLNTTDNSFHLESRQMPPAVIPIPDTSADKVFSDNTAWVDLRIISQPPKKYWRLLKEYFWREETNPIFSRKEGSPRPRVYVFDSGMDTEGPTYKYYMKNKQVEWLHAGGTAVPQDWGAFEIEPREDDHDPLRHGTCMASKAVGGRFGVSKRASITIVRYPKRILTKEEQDAGADASTFSQGLILNGLELILADVRKRQSGLHSVLSLSLGSTPPEGEILPGHGWDTNPADDKNHNDAALWNLLNDLANEGVTIVSAAGNHGTMDPTKPFHGPPSYRMMSYPAIFNDKIPLIAVGAATYEGFRSSSQP